jgi:hypothetical protein|nr:MAG TPA: Phenol hydroxylase [Caudoviricetes sp.]
MLSLIENMFDDTEFDVMVGSELRGEIRFIDGKYRLVVFLGNYKSSSTHSNLKDAYDTARELLNV